MFSSSTLPASKPFPKRSFAMGRAVMALMLREMSTTYGRSPGGYLWAVLEPVAGIALLTLVFAAAFNSPPLGVSFAMFYATGMMPFMMFNDLHNKIATSLLYSKQLLTYPTVTYIDAILARFFLNLITQLLVSYLVLGGIMMFMETRIAPNMPIIILAFSVTACLALSLGILNAYLFTRFPVIHRGWSIIMRPMFILSGIFMLLEMVPTPYDGWLWWNPLIHTIGLMRAGFYDVYNPTYISLSYVLGICGICCALGLVFLKRNHRELINN